MENAYITFRDKVDADKAVDYMDRSQIDGSEIRVQKTLGYNPPNRGSPRRGGYPRGGGRGGRGGGNWRRSPSPFRNRERPRESDSAIVKKRSPSKSPQRESSPKKSNINSENDAS